MSPVSVNYWAEGPTDRAAARKLIISAGAQPGADYSLRRGSAPGKDHIDKRLAGFNSAARFAPWLILRDSDGECAAELAARLLGKPAASMRLRIVVPAMEAWLMADRTAFADRLGIPEDRLPAAPEHITSLKRRLIELAGRSRLPSVRRELVPTPRSGRIEGPGYADFLIAFISEEWSPARAAANAPSLSRAIKRLAELTSS